MTDDEASAVFGIITLCSFVTVGLVAFIGFNLSQGADAKRYQHYNNTSKFGPAAWLYDQGYRLAKTQVQKNERERARIQHRKENAQRKGII